MKLYESNHPYYFSEGNYFDNSCHDIWDDFDHYIGDFGNADIDYNLVIRWDWRNADIWEYEDGKDRLMIQMVKQRKAILCSHEIPVTEEDEPRIREYLRNHAERLAENWAPMVLEPSKGE
jgi:hypothetical protein